MDWKKVRVLVLDGASRQVLPIIKGLHELGCNITTLNTSKMDNGYVSKYPDEKLIIPYECYTTAYDDYIFHLIKTKNYDVLFPLSDKTMDIVTEHFDEMSQYIRLPTPSRSVFLDAYNKQRTMEICMDNGIPCPITKRRNESLNEIVEKIGLPLIAKPRMANGSRGLKIIRSREQLNQLVDTGVILLEDYVIQEFIPQTGKQYNVHMFASETGEIIDTLVTEKTRWFPIDGGASCLCRTITNKEVGDICKRLLQQIGWKSYCEIELIVDPRDGIAKVMEINGRASASIKILELAGINIAEQMLEMVYGLPITLPKRAKEDIRLRCIYTDVLWFLKSKDRFSRKPSWFSLKNTHDVLFSIHDPLPFFAYIIKKGPSYREEMEKRKRS